MTKGRPRKDTVEYFPHFVHHDTTVFVLQSHFANNGYALWYKTLELLGSTHGHALRLEEPIRWQHYCAYCFVTEQVALGALDLLASLEVIDKDLWQTKKIVWCQQFVDSIAQVYEQNRQRPVPRRPGENPQQETFSSGKGDIPEGKSNKGERSNSDKTEEEESKEEREENPDAGTLAMKISSVSGNPCVDQSCENNSQGWKLYGETVRMKPSDHDAFCRSEGSDVTALMIKILDDRRLASAEWLANKAKCAPGEWPTRGTYGYADDARAMASAEWCIPVARKLFKSKGGAGKADNPAGKRRSSGSALLDKVEEMYRTGQLK